MSRLEINLLFMFDWVNSNSLLSPIYLELPAQLFGLVFWFLEGILVNNRDRQFQ